MTWCCIVVDRSLKALKNKLGIFRPIFVVSNSIDTGVSMDFFPSLFYNFFLHFWADKSDIFGLSADILDMSADKRPLAGKNAPLPDKNRCPDICVVWSLENMKKNV